MTLTATTYLGTGMSDSVASPMSSDRDVHAVGGWAGGDAVRDDVLPRWFPESVERIRRFLALEAGWDSYDARPLDPDVAQRTAALLWQLADLMETPPNLFPTARGGVQLDWDLADRSLEVELLPGDLIEGVYIQGDEEVEFGPMGDLSESEETVRHYLDRLLAA